MAHDGHRLFRMGVVQFLLGLLVGFAVPRFAVPRLGLSTHRLGITQGTFLMVAVSISRAANEPQRTLDGDEPELLVGHA